MDDEKINPGFKKKLSRFFKSRYVLISQVDNFAIFLLEDFLPKQLGVRSKKRAVLRLNESIVLRALLSYLKVEPENAKVFAEILGFKKIERKISLIKKDESKKKVDKKRSGKNLIYMLGRKHQPTFKLTSPDGSALPAELHDKAKKHFATQSLSFSPVRLRKDLKPRERAEASDGEIFEKDMHTSEVALWRKRTPTKTKITPSRINFFEARVTAKPKVLNFDDCYDAEAKKNTIETFEFQVSGRDILARTKVKRGVSQIKLMGNISALKLMESIGVIIQAKQNGRDFHYAHRQGFALNGAQVKENLDPTTAGSNYDTLFKVEKPIADFLKASPSLDTQVSVKGQVHFEEHGLPCKIIYSISCGAGRPVEVTIDTLNHRLPSVEEHLVAGKMMSFSFSL